MIGGLLPSGVEAVEAFEDIPGEPAHPGEADLIARAVESRRCEFVTTRRCAREALGRLGVAPLAIRPGERREPRWPSGVVGSMTHCAGYRAAAVARTGVVAGLGIDAEPHQPLPAGLEPSVMVDVEPTMLTRLVATHPGIHWNRMLFSAKEAVYKAWFPLTRRWLGFEDVRLAINPAGSFTARLSVNGTRVDDGPALAALHGRFLIARDLIVTVVVVPPTTRWAISARAETVERADDARRHTQHRPPSVSALDKVPNTTPGAVTGY